MGKLFGTDGVRGVANRELTPELALRLGRAGAYVLTRETHHAPKVLVAKDTRRSGEMLEAALTAGLCSLGAQVYLAGDMPTPAVAYLIKAYKFDAGVMLSASHNPMPDNGIKFFNSDGQKLSDALEEEIEALVYEIEANDTLPRPEGADIGIVQTCDRAEADYAGFLLSTVPDVKLPADFTIALDCANGATSNIASRVFMLLGATVHTLHNNPDGLNINDNCGSTHMDSLLEFVQEKGADIGLAFDGDGDRMLAVDEKGNMLDGDAVMAICGLSLKNRGALANDTIVGTVMSNQGLDVFCRENDITLVRTDVGDRYVLEKMLADGLTLGGEQSGHVIFRQFADTGDGILTGLQLVAALAASGKPLSELRKIMTDFPQVLVNAQVDTAKKNEFSTHPAVVSAQKEIEEKLAAQQGRILVRPSGTEPLVRVMIEGRDQAQITMWAQDLAQIIRTNLG
ncbi:MAG: phosphoglucosamine mutase [Defluviitaleaceae bacterium]|nr:phosphoglucosamine mutase [Defluviitaleaceae bacterium]MCL2273903.1 phosphoglucosamine mutase [Defluviitaleaceae bacterium]